MALISLTLNGFYEFDQTIFDDLIFPDGIVKDSAVDHIMERAGDFEVLYTDPDVLKYMITMWGKRHYFTFKKWIDVLNMEYNPIHNYDRYEFAENTAENGATDTSKQHSTDEDNGQSDTITKTSSDSQTEHKVSAYDSSDYSPKDYETTDTNGTENVGFGETRNNTHNAEAGSEHSDNHKDDHKAHIYGNIGVTTSQQMIQSEIDLARFEIYEEIAKIFLKEFSIMVY